MDAEDHEARESTGENQVAVNEEATAEHNCGDGTENVDQMSARISTVDPGAPDCDIKLHHHLKSNTLAHPRKGIIAFFDRHGDDFYLNIFNIKE